MIDYESVLKTFQKYIKQFDSKNKDIAMKISHSYHTADLACKLAKRLELSEEEINLAKTIGLIHDIGRFVQYEKTGIYNDIVSNINHAEVAVDYLFSDKHIDDFKLPEKYFKVIKASIANHNKLEIDTGLTELETYWTKFLRDIDKIDIFRQQASSLWVYNEPINNIVKKSFYNHTLVRNEDIINKSDEIVGEIALVYDINFKESFELLYDTDNLELFLSVIEVNHELESEFELIKQEIRNYLKERGVF